jgi:hypothetical protein
MFRSQIDARLDVLRELWDGVDETWREHQISAGHLWGLIGERYFRLAPGLRGALGEPDDALADRHLPFELLNRIDDLWSTCVLERWPDALVFEPFPRAAMAETFGPGLKFWQAVSLTAWFVSEGPGARSSLSDLQHHSRRELSELEAMGTPVPPALFDELTNAERKTGAPENSGGKLAIVDLCQPVCVSAVTSSFATSLTAIAPSGPQRTSTGTYDNAGKDSSTASRRPFNYGLPPKRRQQRQSSLRRRARTSRINGLAAIWRNWLPRLGSAGQVSRTTAGNYMAMDTRRRHADAARGPILEQAWRRVMKGSHEPQKTLFVAVAGMADRWGT